MIKEVLILVRDGDLLSKGEIADKMGIQEPTLDSIFSLLSTKGYIRKIDNTTEPSGGCTRCSGCAGCTTLTSTSKIYTITEKGKNYLQPK